MSPALTINNLNFDGVCNCRDLGGYATALGRMAPGLLVRGANLSTLTASGEHTLRQLPVSTIIDLRSARERQQKPNRAVSGAQTVDIDVLEGVMGEGNASPQDMFRRATNETIGAMMPNIYRAFVADERCHLAWRRVLAAILDAPAGAVYFHCAAGKDRTGFVAALVLLALGAHPDTVMEDYLYSNVAREVETERLLRQFMDEMPDKDPEALRGLLEVRADYLALSWQEANARFGSVDNFLSRAIGMTPALRERLASHLIG